jgi:hypothetical protein
MGILLAGCAAAQVAALGEWYLATVEFLAAGILQMILGVLASLDIKKIRLGSQS